MRFLTTKQPGNVIIIPPQKANKSLFFLTWKTGKALPPVSLPGRVQEEAGNLTQSGLLQYVRSGLYSR